MLLMLLMITTVSFPGSFGCEKKTRAWGFVEDVVLYSRGMLGVVSSAIECERLEVENVRARVETILFACCLSHACNICLRIDRRWPPPGISKRSQ